MQLPVPADMRGRGLGKEMRQAVLHLAFEGLGGLMLIADRHGLAGRRVHHGHVTT